jgi:hypothetical protein
LGRKAERIWSLLASPHLAPTGIFLAAVSAMNGLIAAFIAAQSDVTPANAPPARARRLRSLRARAEKLK